ncbi:hypothetical protein EV44_g3509 [Erysiphe necator]|uniref:Uncharacterized protein n=1 Tax=Uncinula necator TaxID=52586 RepID=A0A0B1NYE0_UNCNE|nr:hypothetical protein EV44_g3509 [Erysiphe necator]
MVSQVIADEGSLFSIVAVGEMLSGERGSMRGEDQYIPLDFCHLTIPNIFLLVPALSIVSLKNFSLVLRITRRYSFLSFFVPGAYVESRSIFVSSAIKSARLFPPRVTFIIA